MKTFQEIFNEYIEKITQLSQKSMQKKDTLERECTTLSEILSIPDYQYASAKTLPLIEVKRSKLEELKIELEKENQRFPKLEAKRFKPHLSDIFETSKSIIELENIDFSELFFTENGIKCNSELIVIDKHCKFTNCNITSLKFENYSNLEEEQKFDLIFDDLHNKDDNNLNILIENSHFYGKFYINKKNLREDDSKKRDMQIQSFHIKNSIFHQNFKLHYASIEEFELNDSNFENKADFFNTKFINGKSKKPPISFYAINFNELAIFEECEFCEKVDFTYVTFKGLSQFRKAIFKQGLNLDNTNIEKDMNFFEIQSVDSSASKERTSQETYRIIKHQLEKQNNKIEANRYYSCELEKRREYLANNLSSIENILSYIVFSLHNMTSANARNWFLVLLWIFITGLFTTLACNSEIPKIMLLGLVISLFIAGLFHWTYFPIIVAFISSAILFKVYYVPFNIDEILQHTNLLFDIGKENNFSSILFANKIALGYLYYQFITSVRKDTSK